ncbi:hypothetical protein [Pseudomonas sp. SCB32]|uniref:hypothetical protein n=1 Tax=Pseudomonas sp. SCB32 TaxID=2653853 RepID=UPI0012651F61|nr:hypothetical protein [Pseudomonas sp. SCB32]
MNRDPHEQQLLEHYRRHSDEQPSAQLDARILAAARAAVQEQKPSFGERLRHWLLGTGSRQRWGVAVAGLATLGIGLSLTLRSFDEAPERFDAPVAPAMMRAAPAPAPAMAPAAPLAAEPAEAKRKVESVTERPSAAPPAAKVAGALAEEAAPAARMADALAPEEPQASLLRLRALQQQGREADARELRQALQRQFPKLDIDAALNALPPKP